MAIKSKGKVKVTITYHWLDVIATYSFISLHTIFMQQSIVHARLLHETTPIATPLQHLALTSANASFQDSRHRPIAVFWNSLPNGRSKKDIQGVDFDTNRKRICNFLLVIKNNTGPIVPNLPVSEIVYRVRQIKVIPCGVLLISQQRIGIFTRKYTRIFLIHIYA